MRIVTVCFLSFFTLFGYNLNFSDDKEVREYVQHYIDIGKTYANSGKYKTAIWFYKKALKIIPYLDTAFCNIGLAYYHMNKPMKALSFCKKAIYSNPNNIELYKYTAMIYNDMQKYYMAYKVYSKALEIDPNDIDSLVYLGDFYGVIKRDYNSSMNMYKRAIQSDSLEPKSYFHAAYLYIDLRDYKNAIQYLKKSIKLGLKNAEAYHSLFQLELVENLEFDKDIEDSYIAEFHKYKNKFAVYEMLKIMREIYVGKKSSIDEWINRYKDVNIPSSLHFELLENWIEQIPQKSKRVQLTKALYTFKEHQKDEF